MNDRITRVEDIIKDLSTDLRMSEEMVEENVKYVVGRLKSIMNSKTCTQITLSDKLGIMYCNRKTVGSALASLEGRLRRLRMSKNILPYIEKLKEKLEFLKTIPTSSTLTSKTRYYKTSNSRHRYWYQNRSREEVQNYQNNFANEYYKRIESNK